MKRAGLLIICAAAVLLAAGTARAEASVRLLRIAHGLSSPLYLTAPRGDPRLFIVQQTGQIRVYRGGRVRSRPFLDISGHVSCCGEQGLLSMAFDPNYRRTGRFYVDYTNRRGDSRVAQFRVLARHPNRANPFSKRVLLKVHQPFSNHNGGQLQFGPDGLLYVSFGDGGSEGDPNLIGQKKRGALSKILRLNVNKAHPSPAVYAYGLRNPWRFSFDRKTGGLWIGDVGQDRWEEVDHLKHGAAPGANFGWSYYEGTHVFKTQRIDRSHLRFPVKQYAHSVGGPDNCSVTGGYVYRGHDIPRLRGHYLYADFCSGRIWKLPVTGGRARLMPISFRAAQISSFGQGSRGELYVVSLAGSVYKIVRR
jgi:glucose/arabinose dehydrogenase